MSSLAGALGSSPPVLPHQHLSLQSLDVANQAFRPSWSPLSTIQGAPNDSWENPAPIATRQEDAETEQLSTDATSFAPQKAPTVTIELEEVPPPPVRRTPIVPAPGAWAAAATDDLEPSSMFALPEEDGFSNDMDDREPGSHASRHASKPILPSRITKKARKGQTSTDIGDQALLESSQIWSEHQHALQAADDIRGRLESDISQAALKLRVKPEKIRGLVMGSTFCKTSRRPNLWNAKQKWVTQNAAEELTGLTGPARADVIRRIANENEYLVSCVAGSAEAEELLDAIQEERDLKTVGVRRSSRAAAPDYAAAAKRLEEELTGLNTRIGVRGIIFLARGHLNDPGIPEVIASGDSADFCLEQLGKSSRDLAAIFEAWSLLKGKEYTKALTVFSLSENIRTHVNHGLANMLNLDLAMNWSDPESITAEHGVKLSGWPSGIPLARPLDLRKAELILIWAALKENVCRWVRVPKDEQQVLMEQRASKARSQRSAKSGGAGGKGPNKRKKGKAPDEAHDSSNNGDDINGNKENENDAAPREVQAQKKRKTVAKNGGKAAAPKVGKPTATKAKRSTAGKAQKTATRSSLQNSLGVDSEPDLDEEEDAAPASKRRRVTSAPYIDSDNEDEDL